MNDDGTFKDILLFLQDIEVNSHILHRISAVYGRFTSADSFTFKLFDTILGHDDTNRALMGSNVPRQVVLLLYPEAPIVGTGVEAKICQPGTGIAVHAKRAGKVIKVVHNEIVIKPTKQNSDDDLDVYELVKYQRTNQDTNYHQRPVVNVGDVVKAGGLLV